MFYLVMPEPADRSAFIAGMGAEGIGTPFHYVPLHSAPAGQRFGRTAGSMEHTDHVAARLVRLPMFFGLDADVDHVVETCRKVVSMLLPRGR